jgi:hypothetical protein
MVNLDELLAKLGVPNHQLPRATEMLVTMAERSMAGAGSRESRPAEGPDATVLLELEAWLHALEHERTQRSKTS